MGRPNRLFLYFALLVGTPGIVLAWFAWRGLEQERGAAEREARDQGERIAEGIARRLEEDQVKRIDALRRFTGSTTVMPGPLRDGVVAWMTAEGWRVWPQRSIPWRLERTPRHELPQLPEAAVRAEALEFQDQLNPATTLYREALRAASARQTPFVLHRLARSLQKAGAAEEAERHWRSLREWRPVVSLGGVPSDFVARYQLRDPGLYGDLVAGKWGMSKESFLYYSSQLRTGEVDKKEQQRLEVAAALEAAIESAQARLSIDGVEWICLSVDDPSRIWLSRLSSWKPRLTPAEAAEYDAALGEPARGISRVVEGPAPLRLNVWARNPLAASARYEQRRNLYLGVLILVAGMLAFGVGLTWRTVGREIEMARLKNDFVATVSHEFRSPLAGISQLGEMLRDGRVRDEARRQEYYEMIVGESQRLRRLVENLLDFARIEEGRKQYRFERVALGEWLSGVADEFRRQYGNRGCTLESAIGEALPAVRADREALSAAVHNLLDNAVKYSPDARSVWLSAERSGQGVAIHVRDLGIGISEEDRRHVFDKFYRGGPLKNEVKGAGLGLSLVRRIVADHGGRVTLVSRLGEGSTFTLLLPAED